ncbi:DUF2268 domain-containing protein [Bacillus shivajii]|uniref:DUF2268 domain-containing protein n=1 Tax=Bacillus shivajii TaxID=1983719 RepID=UPI001CF9B4D6|nr:DUF2268 domain-containing putative Zn-dependent protease [Bacillus shivajii]UCZ51962.1 DUF2268 domain-containing protein [Bacillus shivajii]
MPVIHTTEWMLQLIQESDHRRGDESIPRFSKLFEQIPEWTDDQWIAFLYQNGLKPIHLMTRKKLAQWHQTMKLNKLERHWQKLKEEFSGPDAKIFIFPVNDDHSVIMESLRGKNGVSFPTFLLLFYSEDIPLKEKLALLTHEYHHVCRLHYQNHTEESVSLLESMIMEGLAEIEVERTLGEEYKAPWTNIYTTDEIKHWWKYVLEKRKDLIGRRNHHIYMFGGKYGIPKWIGYRTGYEIVKSYCDKHGLPNAKNLLKESPEELLRLSSL